MTVTLSSSYPLPDGNNQLPSLAYLKQVIENVVISALTRDEIDGSSSSLITKSASEPASPSNGEMWLDTSESPYVLKFYDGAAWVAQVFVGTDTPSATTVGLLWYDKTLKVFRVYESRNGITGWHSTHGGYDLYQNTGGIDIESGDVVVRDFAQTVPAIQESTLVTKLKSVVGVAVESISNATYGLVAKVGSGLTVKCQVDNSTYGIVEGDMLVTDAFTRGTARSVGLRETNIYQAIGQRSHGIPYGAFGMAAEAPAFTGNGTMDVALLDSVGEGRVVYFSDKLIADLGDTTADNVTLDSSEFGTTNWNEIDIKESPATAGSLLESDKHEPVGGVFLNMSLESNAAYDGNMNFGDASASVQKTVKMDFANGHISQVMDFFVATSDGSGAQGNKFYIQMPGDSDVAAWDLQLVGYIY